MNRPRFPVLVVVALVVGNVLLVASVAYPVSEAEPRPAAEAFESPVSDEYHLLATIVTDGESTLEIDGAVAASGERYVRTVQGETVVERYQPNGTSGPEYARYVVDESEADARMQQFDDENLEVLTHRGNGESVTITTVDADPSTDGGDRLAGAASVVATQLRLVQYDTVDHDAVAGNDDSPEIRTLRPESGWYAGEQSYRISDAEGTVEIDPETSVLVAADVRWELTRGTETSLHYLLNRDATVSQEVTYEYRTENVSVDRPDWVENHPEN
ncbi:hypothetical protein RH858_10225 [Halalkaliarchaeum sp. AArc-GB]|uniref:hypothetical protein n=1 Tax=Halalkaliarchaeum sp. AArc-GB TaxID=3074078 RepID=UPI0028615F8B|nr:hypothetical protein [Halalkaliarchaeum sp. AArc-GB]MDR5673515.1 hypothetical protein [Halalkaliarchaeum sp. AArc-GB]